jgi:hypothetical protein
VAGSGSGQLKAYVNGVLKLTASGSAAVTPGRLFIGNDGRGFWLDGSVAAVKIYDAPLTQAEIAQEMQQFGPVRTTNLNAFYPLQSAGTAAADTSGNDRLLVVSGSLTTDPNGPALLAPVPLTTPEDTPLSGTFQASDPDGNPLTYSLVDSGSLGTAVLTDPAGGSFTYTPNPNATGTDTLRFKVNDGLVDSNVATITVVVSPVNDAPVASDATAAVLAGATVSGTLTATDVDSATLTFALVNNGVKGTAIVTNPATGAYTYTSNGGVSGTDTFTFRASDGSAFSNVATVTITISPSPAPVAYNGSLTTSEDTATTGSFAATDPNNLPLSYSIVANGTRGTAVLTNTSTGAFTYTPVANANGSDVFTFRASNGTYASNTGTVSVTITPVNDVPIAQNATISTMAGTTFSGTLTATDPDGDLLSFVIVTNGTKGTATISNPSTGAFTYTTAAGVSGSDSFTFRVNDATANSNVATVSITIGAGTPTNRAPVPTSGGEPAKSVRFDSVSDELFRTSNLPPIGNFTMMGWFKFVGDTNAYSAFLRLGHESTSNGYNLLRCCGGGWRELDLWNGAGIWTALNSFQLGSWYHLAVVVSGSGAGQVKTYVNGALALTSAGNPNVTAARFSIGNDTHQEWLNGNAAAVKLYDVALSGAEIAKEMNALAPVRTSNLNSWYPLQSSGTATLDYSGNNRPLSQGGTLLTDSNGPPVTTGYTTPPGTTLTDMLHATDPDGDPLTFSLSTGASHGTVTVNPSGMFTYTPAAGYVGSDAFTYSVTDGMATVTATVTITITP